jgi:hypothetical protein
MGPLIATHAWADGKNWWLDIEGGVEYDDNVAVDENDATANLGDVAATFEVDAGYKVVDDEDSKFEASYEFYQSVYADQSAFNYQTHYPKLEASTKLGGVRVGFTSSYLHALLDGAFFLDQLSFSPSISAYLTDDFYVTAAYYYFDKDYSRADDARDATTHRPGTDVYYYFDRPGRGYLSLGGSYTTEDAAGPEFDYEGFVGRAAIQFPIVLCEHRGRLRFSYAYQMRDYENITPSIGVERKDDRHTLRVYGELGLTDSLKAVAEARFIDRNSNLPEADYQENIASFGLRYSF